MWSGIYQTKGTIKPINPTWQCLQSSLTNQWQLYLHYPFPEPPQNIIRSEILRIITIFFSLISFTVVGEDVNDKLRKFSESLKHNTATDRY